MPSVAFYISGHGFGHASRQIEVVNALAPQLPEGWSLVVRTAAPRWLFDRTLRARVTFLDGACDTGVAQIDSLRLDDAETARAAAAFYAAFGERTQAEATMLREHDARLVIVDAPPLACAAAAAAGIPAVRADPSTVTAPTASGAAPQGSWLAGDLHVHTPYSHDSYGGPTDDNTGLDEAYTAGLTVGQQFTLAALRGLDYLAITDHNDVRSQGDPGFGTSGLIGVRGYENSLDGHAQMLGAAKVYDKSLTTLEQRDALRADGGAFQINHPVEGGELDWALGHDVVPDTVEVWNISRLYQPPLPSASDNDAGVRFWEAFLDAGHHVAATGGSDSHWASTVAIQGAGNPTTWVFADEPTEAGVLRGLRAGRTTISARPPAQGGARVRLEADADGDGTFEAMVGDTVPTGALLKATVDGAPGAELRLITDGGELAVPPVPVTGTTFERRFRLSTGTWVRAEVARPDLAEQRGAVCGTTTAYCRNLLLVEAMTSALYLEPGVTVEVGDGTVTLANGIVERTW